MSEQFEPEMEMSVAEAEAILASLSPEERAALEAEVEQDEANAAFDALSLDASDSGEADSHLPPQSTEEAFRRLLGG
jgi:hypothetical protein